MDLNIVKINLIKFFDNTNDQFPDKLALADSTSQLTISEFH